MKKVLILLVVCFLTVSAAFAGFTPSFTYRENRIEYGLFKNPATLTGSKFSFLAGADATVYSAGEILSNVDVKNFNLGNFLGGYLDFLPVGKSSVLGIEADLGFTVGGFAFDFFTGARVDMELASETRITPEAQGGIALGYGGRVFENDSMFVDVGGALHGDFYAFNNGLHLGLDNIEEISDYLELDKLKQKFIPLIEFNVGIGARAGFFDDHLEAELSCDGIAPIDGFVWDLQQSKLGKVTSEDYEELIDFNSAYKKNFGVNAGVVGKFDFAGFNASLALDVDSINTIKKDDYLGHITVRASLDFAGFIKATAALVGGAPELGLGVDIFGNEVDVIYKVVEGSSRLGQKTVDTLSVRCRVGLDAN